MDTRIRAAVAEDGYPVRQGVRMLLETDPELSR
jgi:hypothetical protein